MFAVLYDRYGLFCERYVLVYPRYKGHEPLGIYHSHRISYQSRSYIAQLGTRQDKTENVIYF